MELKPPILLDVPGLQRIRTSGRSPHVLRSAPTSGASTQVLLRQLVVAVLRVGSEARPVGALLGGEALRLRDAPDETAARLSQYELGVDVDAPREVDDREEQVADLSHHVRVRLGLRRRRPRALDLTAKLLDLLAHLRERPVEIGPVEADRRGAALELARVEERRQRFGHMVEDALALLLLYLQPLPVLADAAGSLRFGRAEDVWMARDELGVDSLRDRLEVAGAALVEEERKEVDLEEQVAELVEQLRVVRGERRVGDLVRLLDRVRHDRLRRLLAVPGAVAPEPLGQLLELEQRLTESHAASRWSTCRSCSWPLRATRRDPGSAGSRPGTGSCRPCSRSS